MDKKKILAIAEIALAVVALVCIFLACVSVSFAGESQTSTGLEVYLGTEEGAEMTFGGILLLIVLIGLVAAPVVKFLKPDLKVLNYVIIALGAVAAILYFCTLTNLMIKDISDIMEIGKLVGTTYGLGYGAWIGAICSLGACACACVDTFVLKD